MKGMKFGQEGNERRIDLKRDGTDMQLNSRRRGGEGKGRVSTSATQAWCGPRAQPKFSITKSRKDENTKVFRAFVISGFRGSHECLDFSE